MLVGLMVLKIRYERCIDGDCDSGVKMEGAIFFTFVRAAMARAKVKKIRFRLSGR